VSPCGSEKTSRSTFHVGLSTFYCQESKIFFVTSLNVLFYHVSAHVVVDFTKDIGFYNCLWFYISLFFPIYILPCWLVLDILYSPFSLVPLVILFLLLLVKFLNHYGANSLIVLMCRWESAYSLTRKRFCLTTLIVVMVSGDWFLTVYLSRPTQPSISLGSVNEDQLQLGRKRQAWFIPLTDVRGVCR